MTAAKKKDGERALRDCALSYPEAREDFPWGESAFKVRNKVFLFMRQHEDGALSLSVKLLGLHEAALDLPFTEPTGYGLGKSGWVSARFEPGQEPPLDVIGRWVDESYRLIAPKKLSALLPPPATPAATPAARTKSPSAKGTHSAKRRSRS